ncbi:P-loop containing nucleoside triphosphate hydrolase protein [Mycena galopus ATCC 62051]|nr:P-loop containing nucleoside triphosphate hydrolase protein [Mycena galopus ATCC 62051]
MSSLFYYLNKIRGAGPPSGSKTPSGGPGHVASSLGLSSFRDVVTLLSHSYVGSSLKLLVLGSVVETGRRIFMWLIERFAIKYCTTIRFLQGDPAYEWIVLFLNQENVWRRSREFTVSASNSQRKWAVRAATDATAKANAEYVPMYTQPQLFRWRGYWVEIKRTGNGSNQDVMQGPYAMPGRYGASGSSISVTVYTLDMNVMSDLVEDARKRYLEVNRPNVVIYLTDSPQFGPHQTWGTVKHKIRRPLSSIILPDGVVDALVADAEEFLHTENWYNEAGIPHRRGYLLYGPPGTGKASTIYALAGVLNLEIYSLSLASNFVDDSYLQRAASAIPKQGLFLIEDIDCAFPSREDEDEEEMEIVQTMHRRSRTHRGTQRTRSMVTLSGLLNVIDGIGSEEGKLFVATTNHIDRLDAALLRPGRIDHKVQYSLASAPQAHALFMRFFPAWRFPASAPNLGDEKTETIPELADTFATGVPPAEFSTAELQGYLQGYKTRPAEAAHGVGVWVEQVRQERREREQREAERREKAQKRKAAALAGLTVNVNAQGMPGVPGTVVPGVVVPAMNGAPVPIAVAPEAVAVTEAAVTEAAVPAVNGEKVEAPVANGVHKAEVKVNGAG